MTRFSLLILVWVKQLIDITGHTFGRLTVLRKFPQPNMWECECVCGTIKACHRANLRSGNTTSCGCLHREQLAIRNSERLTLEEPWLADMLKYKRDRET